MKPVSQDGLFDKVVWGLHHDAFEDPVSHRALNAYQHGICDDLIASILTGQVDRLQRQEALGQLFPFRKPRLQSGELILGKEQYRIPFQWLVEHLLIVGNTGSGKSTLFIWLLLQLSCAFWVSDNYKKQLRHLRRLLGRQGRDLIVLSASDWKFNPLQASGDARIHLSLAIDLLCRLLDLPPRARSILRQTCDELYSKFGIWEGRVDAWPTLFDLYERVKAAPDLNEAARDAILDRLGALLAGFKAVAYRVGWKPEDLACHSIVFEMIGAPEATKRILLETTLFSLFQREVERGVVNGPLNLFIGFDDSQRSFDACGPTGGEIMPELAGIVRGTGKSLCVVVQTMAALSRKLIPNLGTKIFGRLGSHEDYDTLAADLGLTSQQKEWARLHLKPGMFIGQVSKGDWREPFLFNVPLPNIPTVVSDQEARDSVRALDSLPVVPATEFEKWEPYARVEINQSLTDTELRFLHAVVANPGKPSSFYARAVGISGKRAIEVRQRLAAYIREHEVATGQRGRNAIVLEPLPSAYSV